MNKVNFLSKKEKEISKFFSKNGYFIFNINDKFNLNKIRNFLEKKTNSILKSKKKFDFNNLHNHLKYNEVNNFRLKLFKDLNNQNWSMESYYKIFKEYLEIIVGNELVMQNQLNLSVQMPKDQSSVLPMHADSFNGESPFEVVAWLPLVDCYSNKSMFLLPPKYNKKLVKLLPQYSKKNKGGMKILNNKFKKYLKFINIKKNQGLIFSPNFLHGNEINTQKETRLSLNTRFKSLLSPYTSVEKGLGKFYKPIIIREATIQGMKFNIPKKF